MKKINLRKVRKIAAIATMALCLLSTTAFASGTNFDTVVDPIVALINSLMAPALALVGALGSLYCVVLGVKFAKAEEPQEREKAKAHLKSAVIGFVLIFVLLLALNLAMPQLKNWVIQNQVKGSGMKNILS